MNDQRRDYQKRLDFFYVVFGLVREYYIDEKKLSEMASKICPKCKKELKHFKEINTDTGKKIIIVTSYCVKECGHLEWEIED